MIGETIAHYRVLEKLGSGGMGEVYLAEDTKLDRRVALKVLPSIMAGDPERRARFEREAKAIATLNHPNIVTIYSVEEAGDVPLLSMELVEGQTLTNLIVKPGMPLERLLKLAIPLTDAVAAAHQRGITHRDLKPANIMVTPEGRVKVLDFGLAKLREDLSDRGGSLMATRELTGEGRIMGTVAYMSPEQAEGKPLDHRSDIFSLGVILFEMATGERPFKGDTNVSIISSIVKDTPASVTNFRPDVPRDFGRIVKRALTKDPEHRYQTAKDLRNDLEALKEEIDSGEVLASGATRAAAVPVKTASRARLALVAAALVAVGAVAFGVSKFRGQSPAAPTRGAFEAIKLARLTNTGKAGLAAVSPDGRYVVHVVSEGGRQSLWMRQVATTSNVQIVAPAEANYDGIAFSPDGNYVYYSAYTGTESVATLNRVPALGGTPRRLLDDIDTPVSFSPDGRQFAFLRGYQTEGEIAVLGASADGTGEHKLASSRRPGGFKLENVSWSPDGKVLATAMINSDSTGERVVAIDVAKGTFQPIGSKIWNEVAWVGWLADGSGLVVSAFDQTAGLTRQIWHLSYPSGELRRLTNDLNDYNAVSLSADSSVLVSVQAEQHSTIWVAPGGDARRATEITSGSGRTDGAAGVAWTPDGRVVFTSVASGGLTLWMTDRDGRNARQLTGDPGPDILPHVTPDGRHVVFASGRGGMSRIWTTDPDGGNLKPVTKGPADWYPLIAEGGKAVVYTSFAGLLATHWKVPVEGGTAVPLFQGLGGPKDPLPGFDARSISPDGTLAAGRYMDLEKRRWLTAVVSLDGRQPPRKLNVPSTRRPTMSPDGRAVTYIKEEGGVSNIWSQPTDGNPPKRLTSFTSDLIFEYAWAPNGRDLVLARGTRPSDVVLITNVAK